MLKKVALLLLVPVLALAQSGFPPTPGGELLRGWLETFNAGDLQRRAQFIAEHYADSALQGAAPDEIARTSLRFRERVGGGFDLYRVTRETEDEISALVREKGGFGWATLRLRFNSSQPPRIREIDLDQAPAPPEARPVRQDAQALARVVDSLAARLTAEDRFSGVVLMARNGKPIFQKAYGFADREKKIPNQVDTKFRIGSMNKMFTSVAVAQLVERGKLKYTDTLARVLPDYPNKEAAAKITIHQLLTHTAGLGDYFGEEFDKKKESLGSLRDYLPFFAAAPLQFEPGKGWAYSNAGLLVAGLVVEEVSGQNYFDYVHEQIYKPAGMKDSDSFEKTKPQPNQSRGYLKAASGNWVSNYESLPLRGSSAGGGDSTAPDLLKFAEALRSHKLLSPELTELVITGKVDVGPQEKYAYGFEERFEEGKRVVGHGGGAPGMNCDLRIYWESGYTVVVMSNFSPPLAEQLSGYIRERLEQN